MQVEKLDSVSVQNLVQYEEKKKVGLKVLKLVEKKVER
jgi:hypothetical protein